MQPNLELVKANVEGDGVCGLSLPKRPSSSQVLWRNLWKKSITSEINTLILPFGRDKHYQERGIKNLWTCSRSEECVPLWWRGSCWRAGSQGCQHQIAGTSTAIKDVKIWSSSKTFIHIIPHSFTCTTLAPWQSLIGRSFPVCPPNSYPENKDYPLWDARKNKLDGPHLDVVHCSIAAHSLSVVVQVVEDISADMEIEGVFGRPLKADLY